MADRMVWPSAFSRDRKWPRVTKCTHSRVVDLRLEVTLVLVVIAQAIRRASSPIRRASSPTLVRSTGWPTPTDVLASGYEKCATWGGPTCRGLSPHRRCLSTRSDWRKVLWHSTVSSSGTATESTHAIWRVSVYQSRRWQTWDIALIWRTTLYSVVWSQQLLRPVTTSSTVSRPTPSSDTLPPRDVHRTLSHKTQARRDVPFFSNSRTRR